MKQLVAGLVALCVGAPWSSADVFDDIGLTALRASGELMAEGAGVAVGQVEAMTRNGGLAPQSDGFGGKVFATRGVPQGPASDHATYVGDAIYGARGVAPGVTRVSLFEAGSFLGEAGLKTGSRSEPARLGVAVVNHSWTWERAGAAENREALRRLDYSIARDDLVSVHAAANGAGARWPVLLASSMNGITVGLSDGSSSAGPVYFDVGGGRSVVKPDLVVPEQTTSRAAAIVSGSAALLISEGRARGMDVGGLATKAMLMAGAEHLDGYERGLPGAADDRAVPLDHRQGAGELRVDRAFGILVAGEVEADGAGRRSGWAADELEGRRASFNVVLREGDGLSAALAWHRTVKPRGGSFGEGAATVANLDLLLQVKLDGRWWLVEKSASGADNVEIVWRDDLAAGEYRLVVTGAAGEDFALAWDAEGEAGEPRMLATTRAVPEPAAVVASAVTLGTLCGRRRRRA